jgi:hypothetical protein
VTEAHRAVMAAVNSTTAAAVNSKTAAAVNSATALLQTATVT